MKRFLCYDTNDAASGKIDVNSNGVLSPNATVPSTNGTTYQHLVTDGDGKVKWEDRLAYDIPEHDRLVPTDEIIQYCSYAYRGKKFRVVIDGQIFNEVEVVSFYDGETTYGIGDSVNVSSPETQWREFGFVIRGNSVVAYDTSRFSSRPIIGENCFVYEITPESIKKIDPKYTITYFITSGGAIRTGDNWYTGETATVDDIISAYKKGHTRIIDGPSLGNIVGDVVGTYMDSGAHKVTYLHKGVLVNL